MIPAYLMEMPLKVLRGKAAGIEAWLRKNNNPTAPYFRRPTLLDLDDARRERGVR